MQIRSFLLPVTCLTLVTAAGLAAASLSIGDKQFLVMAAKNRMIEAHEGHLAEVQAKRAGVKDLATAMVQDNTMSYQHLTVLAAKAGVTIPRGIDAARDPILKQLVRLKEERFDRQFTRDVIAAHRQAISAFKWESAHGKNAEVKAYAKEMIPTLEKHLHLAEECAKAPRHS